MAGKRKHHTAAFNAQGAPAPLKGDRTANEPAGPLGAHPTPTHAREKQPLAGAEVLFANGAKLDAGDAEARQAEPPEQVGRLEMGPEWAKKRLPPSAEAERPLIGPGRPELSARRQCELLGLNRPGLYYEPAAEAAGNSRPMRLIDRGYAAHPFPGSRRLSNAPDGPFCPGMPDEALGRGRPEVFNADPGVQFTAQAWAGRLGSAGVAVGTGGRGRCLGNVFVGRLWRGVKYGGIYPRRYEAVPQLRRGRHLRYYDGGRWPRAPGYRTPAAVYWQGRAGGRSAG
jgi:transposase